MVNDVGGEIRKLENLAELFKTLTKQSSGEIMRLVGRHLGNTIIPLIGLDDGGRTRGKFVGLLRQWGVTCPDTLTHDRSLLGDSSGKFEPKEFNAGLREGMSIRRERASAEISVIMSHTSHQKLRPRLQKFDQLYESFIKLVKDGINRGGRADGSNK